MRLFRLASFAAVGLALLVSGAARAQADDSSLIPYAGHIDVNGDPMSGEVGIKVSLYDSDEATATALWTEEHAAVRVSASRFTVLLGSVTALSPAILAQQSLYIGVELDDGTGTFPIQLQGRKRFGAAPFAWGGAPGKAFQADGALTSSPGSFGDSAGELVLVNETSGTSWRVPIRAADGDKLQFYRVNGGGTQHVMTMTVDGNVGVGTASPATKLHVAGDLTVDGMVTASTLAGGSLTFHSNRQPDACVTYCVSVGKRMATRQDLLAYVATGVDRCSYTWFLDEVSENPWRCIPMYSARVDDNCGMASPQRPRLANAGEYAWTTSTEATCACSMGR